MPPFTVKKGDRLFWVCAVSEEDRASGGAPYEIVSKEVIASGKTQFRFAHRDSWRAHHLRTLGHHFHQTPEAAIKAFVAHCEADVAELKAKLRLAEAGIAWAKKQRP